MIQIRCYTQCCLPLQKHQLSIYLYVANVKVPNLPPTENLHSLLVGALRQRLKTKPLVDPALEGTQPVSGTRANENHSPHLPKERTRGPRFLLAYFSSSLNRDSTSAKVWDFPPAWPIFHLGILPQSTCRLPRGKGCPMPLSGPRTTLRLQLPAGGFKGLR